MRGEEGKWVLCELLAGHRYIGRWDREVWDSQYVTVGRKDL